MIAQFCCAAWNLIAKCRTLTVSGLLAFPDTTGRLLRQSARLLKLGCSALHATNRHLACSIDPPMWRKLSRLWYAFLDRQAGRARSAAVRRLPWSGPPPRGLPRPAGAARPVPRSGPSGPTRAGPIPWPAAAARPVPRAAAAAGAVWCSRGLRSGAVRRSWRLGARTVWRSGRICAGAVWWFSGICPWAVWWPSGICSRAVRRRRRPADDGRPRLWRRRHERRHPGELLRKVNQMRGTLCMHLRGETLPAAKKNDKSPQFAWWAPSYTSVH